MDQGDISDKPQTEVFSAKTASFQPVSSESQPEEGGVSQSAESQAKILVGQEEVEEVFSFIDCFFDFSFGFWWVFCLPLSFFKST